MNAKEARISELLINMLSCGYINATDALLTIRDGNLTPDQVKFFARSFELRAGYECVSRHWDTMIEMQG